MKEELPNRFGGLKFWAKAMEKENSEPEEIIPDDFQPDKEAKRRLELINAAAEALKQQLTDDEKQKLKAIIVFGSTARGMVMHPKADIDIHIELDPYDYDLFDKIKGILCEKVAGVELDINTKSIQRGSRIAKLLTAQKYPDRPAEWKIIYSRSNQDESELDSILSEQRNNRKK